MHGIRVLRIISAFRTYFTYGLVVLLSTTAHGMKEDHKPPTMHADQHGAVAGLVPGTCDPVKQRQ